MFVSTVRTTTLLALALSMVLDTAQAHMQMASPFPLHSPLNPNVPNDIKDYSMTSPLISDGTYPCKGFINNPASGMDSVETWSAGSTQQVTIQGTATHGGGSCQFSMSYDQGATWNVVMSYVGGCLVDTLTYSVPIPSEAPSGEALFAWSWFNQLGNREMYQNCAVVTVTGGGSGLSGPAPFVANAGVNECITIENIDVVFPDPGSVVTYGGSYAGSKPTSPAGFTGSNCGASGYSSSGGSGSSSSSATTAAADDSTPSTASKSTAASSTASAQAAVGTPLGIQHNAVYGDGVSSAATEASTTPALASATTASSEAAYPSADASTSSQTCKRRRKRSDNPTNSKRSVRYYKRAQPKYISRALTAAELQARQESYNIYAKHADRRRSRMHIGRSSH